MKNYKFKFKYAGEACRISGSGTCKAECFQQAFEVARNGVAKDLKCDPSQVEIISVMGVLGK